MDTDGTNIKRLTYTPGYDGGAIFSNNGKKIGWRGNRPSKQNLTDYLNLLSLGIVDPVGIPMELYTTDIDGSNQKRITNLGSSSFAPYFLPKDDGFIFSSDLSKNGDFQLYAVSFTPPNKVVQITKNGMFNSFPMFSRDGKKIYLDFK